MGLPSRSRGPNSVMSRLESVSHHSTPVMSLSQTAHIEAFVSRLVDAHNFFERIDRGYVSTNSYHNATYDRVFGCCDVMLTAVSVGDVVLYVSPLPRR